MQEATFEEGLARILAKDGRYHAEGYFFVREALEHTQKSVSRGIRSGLYDPVAREKHVKGQELLAGIREFALQQFGPMAITVFEEWGIHNCRDFGEIVFNMVDIGLLKKTANDSRADFDGGYDFEQAFRKPFLPANKTLHVDRTEPTTPAQAPGNKN